MSLVDELARARTEEDIKDAYIRALGLKSHFKGLVDIQTETAYRHYLLERRDSLLPLDEQKFKGAYFTPLHIVDKAYDQLRSTLGDSWQDRYIMWDMCAGVGNLEAKHSNLRNVYMSTLDQADVTIMKSNPAFAGAEIFQYDYLNDDVTDFGEVDYSLSNKVPPALRQAIVDAKAGRKGAKPILVLINPPYGESGTKTQKAGKTAIASTRMGAWMNGSDYGYAAKELFVQFLVRVASELPSAILAIFSKLKYINGANFQLFRDKWNATFLDGFIVHSKAFDQLKGDFPIGFLIWDTSLKAPITLVHAVALDKEGKQIGEKSFENVSSNQFLSEWIVRAKHKTHDVVPLINAVTPTPRVTGVRNLKWSSGAIAHFLCHGNDFQQAGSLTAILSSTHDIGYTGAYFVTAENLWQVAVVFAVRRVIKPTWLNDRDQFLQPSQPLSDEFRSDCLVWMLFHGSNLTAGADGIRWNGRDWSVINHFIPFTEAEVGANGRFESDFMVRYMANLSFTPEAQAVLDAGRTLFRRFHATQFPRRIRDELKLGRSDAGWYQVRRALEAYSDIGLTDFDPMGHARAALSRKLQPMIYSLGFLPG